MKCYTFFSNSNIDTLIIQFDDFPILKIMCLKCYYAWQVNYRLINQLTHKISIFSDIFLGHPACLAALKTETFQVWN